MQQTVEQMVVIKRRAAGDMAEDVLADVGLPISFRLSLRSSANRSLRNSSMEDIRQPSRLLPCRVKDRIDDRVIAGAAADVARNRLDDLFARRSWIAVEQRLGGHQHAWRAITALGRESPP
jgi:hypothetical protein